ncbi:bifunctional DNA primase/polymerase [Methylobacterium segetis]|uniref:bifunctional DNA primase/polymerase n=1 Tax=Methylobacterium segetis TaxID=2488750 RepID=UPI0010527B2D|nr:bifunctional DNA primase/polymerase [Methylobacterium segetis]
MIEKNGAADHKTAALKFADNPECIEKWLGEEGRTFACFGRKVLANGYSVIPLATGDKRPVIAEWQRFCQQPASKAAAEDWARNNPAAGIGLACGSAVIGIDIDILDGAQADLIEGLARKHLGDTPLVRIGMAPKRMLIYRPSGPVRAAKPHPIEVLSTGNQIAAFGIHPRTQKPYVWPNLSPLDTPVSALPEVTQVAVDRFLAGCRDVLPILSSEAQEPEFDEFGYVIGRRDVHALKCAWKAACRRTSNDISAMLDDAWDLFFYGLHPDHRQRVRAKTGRPWAKNDKEFVSKVRSALRNTEERNTQAATNRTQRVLIDDVPPHFGADELSAEQAGKRVRDLVAGWIEHRGKLAIAGAAGIGKSTSVLAAIRQWNREKPIGPDHVWYLTPTVSLAEELAAKYRALGGTCVAVRGRLHEDAERAPLCLRPSFVRAAVECGVGNVAAACCELRTKDDEYLRCPYRSGCPYYEQFENPVEINFMSHEYMLQTLGERFGKPDMVVIDEAFMQKLVRCSQAASAEDLLREAASQTAIMRIVIDALRAGLSPKSVLRNIGVTKKALVAAAQAIEPEVEAQVTPDMSENRALAALDRLPKRNRAALAFRRLADELSCEREETHSIYAAKKMTRAHIDGTETIVEMEIFYIQYRSDVKLRKETPILLLDATANEALLRSLWPDLRFEKIAARRNAIVTQTYGLQAGKAAMTTGAKAGKYLSDLRAFLERVGKDRRGLLVTYKDVLWEGHERRFSLPDGWSATHFGDLRGRDEFKDCDVVVVCGRMQPRVEDVERMARGFFYDRDLPMTFLKGGNFPQVPRGYRLADGSQNGTLAQVHPDETVQALVEQLREAEVVQAIDRLRLLHRSQQAAVYLLTDLPVDVTVDRLEPWRSLVEQRSRIDRAASRLPGVLPLVPDWLVSERPDLWSTKKEASMDIERLLKARDAKPLMRFRRTDKDEDGFIANFGLKAQMYRFKRASHPQGRASRCLSIHTPSTTRFALTALLGELTLFEPPMPVLAAARDQEPPVRPSQPASNDDVPGCAARGAVG